MAPIMSNITTTLAAATTSALVQDGDPVESVGGLAPFAIVAIAVFGGIPGIVCTCLVLRSIIKKSNKYKSGKVTPLIGNKRNSSPNVEQKDKRKDFDIWVNKMENKSGEAVGTPCSYSGTMKTQDYGYVPGQPEYNDPIPEVQFRNNQYTDDNAYYDEDYDTQPVLEDHSSETPSDEVKPKKKNKKDKKKKDFNEKKKDSDEKKKDKNENKIDTNDKVKEPKKKDKKSKKKDKAVTEEPVEIEEDEESSAVMSGKKSKNGQEKKKKKEGKKNKKKDKE
ncbi:unnamed protein product [Owenia fusiformis]|uniref:Uncharacterized protein n=1 Tax=Owenia fusiformis TaxID=6347 RepID=A0A8J1U3D6_OWEFU|nr:unnamed protein product [Owenia fusiformis]